MNKHNKKILIVLVAIIIIAALSLINYYFDEEGNSGENYTGKQYLKDIKILEDSKVVISVMKIFMTLQRRFLCYQK